MLIRHIVFFSLNDPSRLDEVRRHLLDLGRIPDARHFEVGVNAKVDPLGNAIDLVVYAEFDDEAGLAAYKAHPIYAQTTRAVRPLRDLRYSADFTADV